MVKRPKISAMTGNAKVKVLCLLHYHFAHSRLPYMSTVEMRYLIPSIHQNITEYAISSLLSEKLLVQAERKSDSFDDYGENETVYKISEHGIDIVDNWSDFTYDEIAEGISFDEEDSFADIVDPAIDGDQEWEPLPLEKSGPAYKQAMDTTETAFNEIKGSNGYAESDPQERETIVWSLSEGLKQIKNGLPTRDQVVSMLVKPFQYISEKFAGAAMGEAAKTAVKALINWITS